MATCSDCGKRVVISKSSRPSPTCQACRRARKARECAGCGSRFTAQRDADRYCSMSCAAKTRIRLGQVKSRLRIRPDEDPGVKRRHRERLAPGLTTCQRTGLLRKWQRDGRTCTYCGGACETVDHIIALVRGGTNYEGNLTPACRSCNGSKGARTLVEWKHGRPAQALVARPGVGRLKV